jgi:hypothetical protein
VNTGWDDNTGPACAAANLAGQNGILFVTAAGNYGQQHFQGNFNPGTGDANWHDWATGDEAQALNIVANSTANFYLSWNTAGGTYDYDLYLYNANLSTVLASSTNGGNNYEQIAWMNTTGSPVSARLAIYRRSGGITQLEVFGNNLSSSANWEYNMPDGSTSSPSNATNPLVITVGAVDWNSYVLASGSNPIMDYSSRGPSNNGMMLPDLVGPTNTASFAYSGTFSGTSCATPNVAGAMCAFWSDEPQFGAAGVHWVIREQARVAWRDWGTVGDDNVYGAGACHLVNFVTNTTWLARAYGNTSNDPFGPYYTVAAAQSNAAIAGRIMIVLGGHYPELVTLNKQLTYETIGSSAILGP